MSDDDDQPLKYHSDMLDQNELSGDDVRLNPDELIRKTVLNALNALNDDDIKRGLLKFRVNIEATEILCRSADMVPKDYKERLDEYMLTEEYTKADGDFKSFRLSHKKMELLLGNAFRDKPIGGVLKL
jgi:hypothetical protein